MDMDMDMDMGETLSIRSMGHGTGQDRNLHC